MWTHGRRMPTNGNVEPLRDFLVPRVKKLVLIDQPHPGSETVMPKIEIYTNHSSSFLSQSSSLWLSLLEPFLKLTNSQGTRIVFKLRDFLSIIDWSFRDKTIFDYFIGMESINTLAGILMKKMGRVSRVIYYVLDYSPVRYKGSFNNIYLALDRFCATHADFVWDVSPAISAARIQAGLERAKTAPVIHVPIGVYERQIRLSPKSNVMPFSLAYLGTLGVDNGPDMAIEVMPKVLEKYPQTTLHIIGGGEANLARLKSLAKKLNIHSQVKFYGFVVENSTMIHILSTCQIGLAPYRAIPDSVRYYADASKIRSYAAAGLPVITTAVPPLGREVQKSGGAIIAKDDPTAFAKAIVQLFSSTEAYVRMRKQVIKFAKDNTWDNEFAKAFAKSQ